MQDKFEVQTKEKFSEMIAKNTSSQFSESHVDDPEHLVHLEGRVVDHWKSDRLGFGPSLYK